tara:strand:+ start:122781 stop:123407 length:627 start_codon:yes stop_codon:yes gene_type:complete
MEIFYKIQSNLSIYSPILFIVFLFFRRKDHFLRTDKILILIVFSSFLTDLFSTYFVDRNYVYLFIYSILDTVLLLLLFNSLLSKSNKLIILLLTVFFSTLAIEFLYKDPIYEFFSFTLTVKCLIFIILSLLYFYQIYTKEEDIFRSKAPEFWYNVGILIYFSLAFFPFFLSTEIMSGLFDYSLWFVHNIGNVSKNIIFALGLWMVQKR